MKSQVDSEIESFRKLLLESLPPVIARKDANKLLGGMVSAKTLANADSLGEGPKGAYKVGKNIVYSTVGLVDWLIESLGVTALQHDINFLLVGGR